MSALEVVFWIALGLIVYTHVGYPFLLRLLVSLRRSKRRPAPVTSHRPTVSLIIAAHDEEDVIAGRLENALALDYPRDRLEIVVASDGSSDRTVELASAVAARDQRVRVLDLPRRGKVRAQDAAAESARGEILAFSDANAFWESDALESLVRRFADSSVAFVCGQLR